MYILQYMDQLYKNMHNPVREDNSSRLMCSNTVVYYIYIYMYINIDNDNDKIGKENSIKQIVTPVKIF